MALTSVIGSKYKIYFPDNQEDIQDIYLGIVVGQHVDENDSSNSYNLVSIPARGECIQISESDEAKRMASI